eukprot:TRINITY_DN14707_c0_g1_i4.p11 TRINITY_DN14707_c0_g1~~TRINITY_DN14707_c0_g1_i4.p11  ORF type:complete len:105 (+),score=8.15 TRINITY_DN14707_c0_g1_i4:531-845(+)
MYMEFVRYFIYLIWKKNIQIIFQLLIKSIGIKFMYQEIDQELGNRLRNYVEVENLSGIKCPEYIKKFSEEGFEQEICEFGFAAQGAFNNMGLSVWDHSLSGAKE